MASGNPNAASTSGNNVGQAAIVMIATCASDTTQNNYGFVAQRAIQITKVDFVCGADATGTNTTTTLKLKNGSTVVASKTVNATGGTASFDSGEVLAGTLSTTAASLRLAIGDVLNFEIITPSGDTIVAPTSCVFSYRDQVVR